MIKLVSVSTQKAKDDFYEHFVSYQKELEKIAEDTYEIISEDELFSKSKKYSGVKQYFIYNDFTKVGLVIFQDIDYTNPKMLFISQFYIFPEYRHQHFGQEAVKLILNLTSHTTYTWLYVIKKNTNALKFWKYVMDKNGYEISTHSKCNIDNDKEITKDCYKLIYKNTGKLPVYKRGK